MAEAIETKSSSKSSSSCLLVAAFDFGTTYSGYAFSFRNDPMKIQTNQGWNAGSEKLISLKTPTCVLLRPNKKFDSFGYEAENKYADLAEDDKHHGWLLFRRFKMLLHNNEELTRSTTVQDINGKSMRAMHIFAMAIGFLRDHLITTLNTQTVGVNEKDIQYVITVPAIWNDNAKQFMREAAIEAGVDSSRLKLSLQPEAASIWCQTVSTDIKNTFADIGCQYMVIDLGGGTADISVHEKKPDGSLKEIHKASGGPWGGTAVDKNYFAWLTKLFGTRTMKRFKKEQMADYFDVQREFETKKRTVSSKTAGKITFKISASLKDIFKEEERKDLKMKVADMGLSEEVTLTGDKLRLDASIVRSWFKGPISKTIAHVKELLSDEKMHYVQKILLVGGFGECQLVQENLRKKLINKALIVPDEPGLAVLKGAVRFGHMPSIVSSRVMKYTYGVAVVHDEDSSSITAVSDFDDDSDEDIAIVDNVYDKFVEIGEEIPVGHEISRSYTPYVPDRVEIEVYCTEDPDPSFVTDPGCEKLGVLSIQFPDGETCEDNRNVVTLIFGDTELIVKATVLRTGHEFYTTINCLK